MASGRMTANLWWYLFGFYPHTGKWHGWALFKKHNNPLKAPICGMTR